MSEKTNNEFYTDLIELVNSLKELQKTGNVDFTTKSGHRKKFVYIPIDEILDVVKKNQNFAFMQPLSEDENGILGVNNILIHKSGQKIESGRFAINRTSTGSMQDLGSIITYTRRYSLASFLGVSSETDTDGKTHTNEELTIEPPKASTATDKQIGMIKNLYTPEELDTMLTNLKKDIYKLTVQEASKMISARKGKS